MNVVKLDDLRKGSKKLDGLAVDTASLDQMLDEAKKDPHSPWAQCFIQIRPRGRWWVDTDRLRDVFDSKRLWRKS